jgi:hypothetical protein
LKIPEIPAQAYVAPFRAESIKDHHLNEISPMGIVENSLGIELLDQHLVQAFSMLHDIPFGTNRSAWQVRESRLGETSFLESGNVTLYVRPRLR